MSYQTMPPLSGTMPGFVGRVRSVPVSEGDLQQAGPSSILSALEGRLEMLVGFTGALAEGLDEQVRRLAGPVPVNVPTHAPAPSMPPEGALARLMAHVEEIERRTRYLEGQLSALQSL